MRTEDFEKKIVANEWDGGWFCYKCNKLEHWKTEAYIYNDKKYCKNCMQEMINDD